jgi:hypothetical protein
MAKATFQPKWWTEKHGTQWAHLKDALERDWEQTKCDLGLGGRELHQTLTDTLDEAAGAKPIPSPDFTWGEAEAPLMYGVGAREQFGKEHAAWDAMVEEELRTEWDRPDASGRRSWEEVRTVVRHGYDRARS